LEDDRLARSRRHRSWLIGAFWLTGLSTLANALPTASLDNPERTLVVTMSKAEALPGGDEQDVTVWVADRAGEAGAFSDAVLGSTDSQIEVADGNPFLREAADVPVPEAPRRTRVPEPDTWILLGTALLGLTRLSRH